MKTFALIVVTVIELLKSIIQRCGKVTCRLMFSRLNLATKKSHIKQKKVSNLHSFLTLLQNHDSKASF